jgi:hypothetical protein
MNVYVNCHSCGHEISKWVWAGTRVDLARQKGEQVELACGTCQGRSRYHVDDFKAKASKVAQVSALLVFLVGTPLTLVFLWHPLLSLSWSYAMVIIGGLIMVPVTVYSLMIKDDNNRVSTFNRYKMKGGADVRIPRRQVVSDIPTPSE